MPSFVQKRHDVAVNPAQNRINLVPGMGRVIIFPASSTVESHWQSHGLVSVYSPISSTPRTFLTPLCPLCKPIARPRKTATCWYVMAVQCFHRSASILTSALSVPQSTHCNDSLVAQIDVIYLSVCLCLSVASVGMVGGHWGILYAWYFFIIVDYTRNGILVCKQNVQFLLLFWNGSKPTICSIQTINQQYSVMYIYKDTQKRVRFGKLILALG